MQKADRRMSINRREFIGACAAVAAVPRMIQPTAKTASVEEFAAYIEKHLSSDLEQRLSLICANGHGTVTAE